MECNGNGNGNGNGNNGAKYTVKWAAEQMLEFFSDPRRHVQGPTGRAATGDNVAWNNPRAASFCFHGAASVLQRRAAVAGDKKQLNALYDLYSVAHAKSSEMFGVLSVIELSDSDSHGLKEVREVLRAIVEDEPLTSECYITDETVKLSKDTYCSTKQEEAIARGELGIAPLPEPAAELVPG